MKPDRASERAWGLVLFLSAFSLYASFPSRSYVFEGLARAMPIELGRFRNLFNGNYLLYGFVGWCFHHLLRAAGIAQLAVHSLQMLDALAGALGLFVFFKILRRIGTGLPEAFLWSAILGATLGYWRWSTDAEDYIFSAFLLLLNFYALVRYCQKGSPGPASLGALHSLAVLGHIVNLAFAPTALWFIVSGNRRAWKRPALEYAASLCLLTASAYAAALAIARPGGLPQALRWLWGSAAREGAGFTLGGGYSWHKLWQWIRTTGNALTSYSPVFKDPPAWRSAVWLLWTGRILLLLLAGVLALRSKTIFRRHRTVAAGCCVWLASYALIFASWQPDTLVYRTTDLPAICLLLALASFELARPLRLGVCLALAAALGLGNFGAEIFPRSFASNNPDLKRMAFIRDHTGESDWVTGGGGRDELYIPYFAGRRPLVVDRYRDRPEELRLLIRRLEKGGQPVRVSSRTLEDDFWRSYFSRFDMEPLADDGNGFALLRLTPSGQ